MGDLRWLAVALCLSSAAWGAPDARELFQRGSKALEKGDDLEAVADFQAAYDAQPAPSLLYWLGEAHYKAGHSAKAEELFKQYLAKLPDGPKKAEAQARLDELKPAGKPARRKVSLGEISMAPSAPAKKPMQLGEVTLAPAKAPEAKPAEVKLAAKPAEVKAADTKPAAEAKSAAKPPETKPAVEAK